MAEIGRRMDRHRSLVVLVFLVAVLSAAVISSCGGGGGGGGSDGELCDQCGDSPDGPCLPSVTVDPAPDAPQPCNSPGRTESCSVSLACRRKVDSGQRRCFPILPGTSDVDYQFRCDGSRPGGTPRPEPTSTPGGETPTPEPTNCGNGQIEGSEECDFPEFNGETCETRGCGFGELTCNGSCQIEVTSCSNPTNALCNR